MTRNGFTLSKILGSLQERVGGSIPHLPTSFRIVTANNTRDWFALCLLSKLSRFESGSYLSCFIYPVRQVGLRHRILIPTFRGSNP